MVVFLESRKYYESYGLDDNHFEYNGAVKLWLGIISLKNCSAIVRTLEHSFISELLFKLAQKKGIPTITVLDGIFDWNNAYQNPHIKYKKLIRSNYADVVYCPTDKELSGYLNLDKKRVKSFRNPRVFGNSMSASKQNNIQYQVLVTTANTAYFNEGEKQRLIRLLKDISSRLNHLGISFVFRIFDQNILQALDIKAEQNSISGSFEDVCKSVNSIITTPSSISYQAMLLGKRVAHLMYRDSPIANRAAWYIHGSVDLDETLRSLVSEDIGERDEYQASIINDVYEQSDTPEQLKLQLLEIEAQRKEYKAYFSFIERLDLFWRIPYEIFVKQNHLLKKLVSRFK